MTTSRSSATRPGILLINSSPRFGGTERWSLLAGKVLQQKGYPVWYGYRFPLLARRARQYGLSTVHFPLLNDADFYSVLKIVRLVRREHIAVIIPTRVKEYWPGALAAAISGIACIIRLGIVRQIRPTLKYRLLFGKLCHAVLVNARAIQQALLSSGFIDPGKIVCLPNGVEIPERLPGWEAHPRRFVFLFIGALVKRKRVDLLLQAFAHLQNRWQRSDLQLWIVGDGPERAALTTLARGLGIDGRVRFWGEQAEVNAFLKQANAFVLVSENEGFPNAVLEAMAWGVPVIMTPVAGAPEMLRHKKEVYFVPPDHLSALQEAMLAFLSQPQLRRQLREAARAYVQQKHSLEKMGDALEALLNQVVSGKRV